MMHYQIGSSSSHSHRSWAARDARSGRDSQVYADRLPTSAPVPTPRAPHLHTVSLPHPNSASHQSPMSYQHSSTTQSSLISLHPLLSYGPNLMFNVTRDVVHIQLRPGCPPGKLHEPAVHPPVSHMTLIISELPAWTIEVVNPHGVTVNDVLFKIREKLNRGARSHEMQGSDSRAVDAAVASFRTRTRADPREHAQGVKRIDFLGAKVFFVGLARSRNGSDSWEIYFSQSLSV